MGKLIAMDPREEERAARKQARGLAKARREAAKKRAREERSKRVSIIREELARPTARGCRCGITTRTTRAQLWAMEEGCTGRARGGPGYVCPVLAAIRRRLTK